MTEMNQAEWTRQIEEMVNARNRRIADQDLSLTSAVKEATMLLSGIGTGWIDPREKLYDDWQGVGTVAGWGPYLPPNRGFGEDTPVQIATSQLTLIRNYSRFLCATSEFAVSALQNRKNYCVGTGLIYRVKENKRAPKGIASLVEDAQVLIDLFSEANDLAGIEQETIIRTDIDGEAFLRLFTDASGSMQVRFVEPEWVFSPSGDFSPARTYGIETSEHDVQHVKGYWINTNPYYSTTPEFIEASEVMHMKGGMAFRSSKRGRPLFYPVFTNLRRVEALGKSLSAIAVARAKIALIRRLKGGTATAAERLKDKVTAISATKPVTGDRERNIENFEDGTILTTGENIDYEYPNANLGATDFLEVFRQELKNIAASVVMPEWMLTSNASDMGSYTSSLVAEAPSTKMFLALQKTICDFFGNRRINPGMSLLWRYLRHCTQVGLLDPRALQWLEIETTAPSLQTRDPKEESDRIISLIEAGIITKEEGRDELGYKPLTDKEQTQIDVDGPTSPDAETGGNSGDSGGSELE
jgi:capsid protein